jgi:hypothetical protein
MEHLARNERDEVLYETSPGAWMRVFAVAIAAFALWLFVLARNDEGVLNAVALWGRSGWWIRAGIVLAYVFIPGILLDTFIEKVEFGSKTIRRRDQLARWRIYSYDEVDSVEVHTGQQIRIRFKDGRAFTIFSSVADLDRVEAIIRARMFDHAPIVDA